MIAFMREYLGEYTWLLTALFYPKVLHKVQLVLSTTCKQRCICELMSGPYKTDDQ